MHSDNINEFLNKSNSEYSTIPSPSINTGQNNKYWTSNRQTILKFLNTYINKNHNNKNYKKINILNDVKEQLFFNYNFNYNTLENNDDTKISIIIGLISLIVISIGIIFWLYFRKKYYVKTTENPFKIVMN